MKTRLLFQVDTSIPILSDVSITPNIVYVKLHILNPTIPLALIIGLLEMAEQFLPSYLPSYLEHLHYLVLVKEVM